MSTQTLKVAITAPRFLVESYRSYFIPGFLREKKTLPPDQMMCPTCQESVDAFSLVEPPVPEKVCLDLSIPAIVDLQEKVYRIEDWVKHCLQKKHTPSSKEKFNEACAIKLVQGIESLHQFYIEMAWAKELPQSVYESRLKRLSEMVGAAANPKFLFSFELEGKRWLRTDFGQTEGPMLMFLGGG